MSISNEATPILSHVITQSQIDEELRCSVCREDFRLSEMVSRLVCNHVFHTSCITPWLERRQTCPVCRRKIYESTIQDNYTDDEFADDEDDLEDEVVLLNGTVANGTLSFSVGYNPVWVTEDGALMHTSVADSRSSDVTVTLSDTDSSELYDLTNDSVSSNSFSTYPQFPYDEDVMSSFESPYQSTNTPRELNHFFLESDNSSSDTSDTIDVDLMTSFESSDLNLSFSSNLIDLCYETTMDLDVDQDMF